MGLKNSHELLEFSRISVWQSSIKLYQPITGATNQTFTATVNGSYAVIVTDNICSDTSACFEIVSVGIFDQNPIAVKLFPNPASQSVNLDLGEIYPAVSIEMTNTLGQIVKAESFRNLQSTEIDVSTLNEGIYIVRVIVGDKMGTMKFLKD